MSLEESMKELAESNRELAEAQREYAKTIRECGTQVVVNETKASGKAAEKAEKAEKAAKPLTAAEKKKAAAAAAKADEADEDDEDGFGEEAEEEETLDHDAVRALLVQVKNTNGDKEEALELIRPFGYDTIPKIQEKDFAKIAKAARTWLKKNG